MNFTLLCTVLWVQVCLARNVNPKKNSLRIVGGRNATEDEFPYVVKIMMQSFETRAPTYVFLCTSVVLTSVWTLSAGHCVIYIGRQKHQKAVIGYQPSATADVVYSEVLRAVSHPSGNVEPYRNDIGLLHTQPVLLAKYGKLSPIDYKSLYGHEVSIVGYGIVNDPRDDTPRLPRVLEVIVKQCDDLSDLYPQICFAPSCSMSVQGPKSICPGDSGGPAIHASGVVSTNSLGDYPNCGMHLQQFQRKNRFNTAYDSGTGTPVSPYIEWISHVINLHDV